MNRDKLKKQSYFVGVLVFSIVVFGLFSLQELLSDLAGQDWAEVLIFVPAFFAIMLVGPIAERYALAMERRMCRKRGHDYEKIVPDNGQPYLYCRKCGDFGPAIEN